MTFFLCELCNGNGWVPGSREWPEKCPCCNGAGRLTFGELAKLLEEDPETLRRTMIFRNRRSTAQRILYKVVTRCLSLDLSQRRSPPDTTPGSGHGLPDSSWSLEPTPSLPISPRRRGGSERSGSASRPKKSLETN